MIQGVKGTGMSQGSFTVLRRGRMSLLDFSYGGSEGRVFCLQEGEVQGVG